MGSRRNGPVRKEEAGLTVGYHAPPPGSRSGIADYAETLKRALARLGKVTESSSNVDVHLYHLGNNRLHEGIYAQALAAPGVVVLHDAVLHHFMLGTLSHDEYISEWVYNSGEWLRDLGEALWRDRARSAFDPRYFQFPMLRRILELSRGVIVHNPGAAAIVAGQGGQNITVIPHFCELDPRQSPHIPEIARFREQCGIGHETTWFGVFGYLREPKRVMACIRAFKRVHALRPRTALLLSGASVSPDLDRLLRSEATHPAIRRLGHQSERDFTTAAAAVDCCLNLRYPGVGETSGIAIRLMGFGKPVVVTDNAENSGFPETAVLRVSAGVAESAELFERILLVTEYPRIAREIGSEAQSYVREYHALEPVARKYWEALCAAAS
jgi:glycosyltransferase involved in cell wall biosynthesis